jgi:hypothetical protein
MALYDHEGTRGLAPLSILGQPPGWLSMSLIRKKSTDYPSRQAATGKISHEVTRRNPKKKNLCNLRNLWTSFFSVIRTRPSRPYD